MGRLTQKEIAAREREERKQRKIAGLEKLFLNEDEGGRWRMSAYFALQCELGEITPEQLVQLNPRPVPGKPVKEVADARIERVKHGETDEDREGFSNVPTNDRKSSVCRVFGSPRSRLLDAIPSLPGAIVRDVLPAK